LPEYLAALQSWLAQVGESLASSPIYWAIQLVQVQVMGTLASWSTEIINWFLGVLAGLGSGVVDAFLIVIISIYMLAGGRRIHRSTYRVLPRRYGNHFLFVTEALSRIIGGYIRAQLVLSLLLGAAVTIGLSLLGMPYALVLGLLAMVLGLIPMFGSALSAVPALLVALGQPPPMFLWVLIFFIVVQNVQDQVLAPRIQGHAVGLHPLAVMFALLAGAQLGGFVGAIFALPAAALVWIILVAVYRSLGLEPAEEPQPQEAQRDQLAVQAATTQEQPVPHA
jgi:predicted PurR-regulated permease PerM